MSSTSVRRIACVLALCGSTLAGPAWADPNGSIRAPHLKPDPSSPEGGIWDQSDKAETHVRTSAELDRNPALDAYVHAVICKVAPDYCGDLRTYVLDRPFLNAAAAPNGYVEVNSGLLLRVRDEDGLAFVLGHEITHFARNHLLERWQAQKNTANMTLLITAGITLGAGAAMYSTARAGGPNASQSINSISTGARSLNDLVYLAGISSLFAFSRDEESEADRLGLERVRSAGYRPAAAIDMWNEVIDENKASDFPRVRESDARASIFATHPVTTDRIAALQALAGPGAAPGPDIEAARRYRAIIRPYLGDWLQDDLRRRDYGQTLFLINRLAAEGEDQGLLAYYRGEVYRHRRNPGDDALALASYKDASAQPDAPAAAWRELGDACTKAGDRSGARDAFSTYLAKAPEAQDRWLVEDDLKSMQAKGAS